MEGGRKGEKGKSADQRSVFFVCRFSYVTVCLIPSQTLWFVSLSSSSDPLSSQASENFMSRGNTRDVAGLGTYKEIALQNTRVTLRNNILCCFLSCLKCINGQACDGLTSHLGGVSILVCGSQLLQKLPFSITLYLRDCCKTLHFVLQVTSGFELYAAFSPLVTKPDAINAINKLLRWIKVCSQRCFFSYLPC